MSLIDKIGQPAMVELCAEEAVELAEASTKFAHACLKLARKMRGENPTPKVMEEILANLNEECADVLYCINKLVEESNIISYESIDSVFMAKGNRAEERVNKIMEDNPYGAGIRLL